jgi:RNA polymerase sigma factor (sigma-70 family)
MTRPYDTGGPRHGPDARRPCPARGVPLRGQSKTGERARCVVTMSDAALGGRVDEELAAFCRAEYGRLVGALSLYCRDRHVAEELAQDTIVRVIGHWRTVQSLDSPSAWAHRVAINLANSHLRRRLAERRAVRRLFTGQVVVQQDPDTPTAVAVRAAVAGLPRRERAVVVLRFFADFSVRDVAHLLGLPEGTVKTLTARALAGLRNAGLRDLREADDAHHP